MLTDEQITMLVDSYGLEQLLLDNDVDQECVLRLLVAEGLLENLGEYFENAE